jgi:hypothetical protein
MRAETTSGYNKHKVPTLAGFMLIRTAIPEVLRKAHELSETLGIWYLALGHSPSSRRHLPAAPRRVHSWVPKSQ